MDTNEVYKPEEAHPRQSSEREARGGLLGVNKEHLTHWRPEEGEAAAEGRQDDEGTLHQC